MIETKPLRKPRADALRNRQRLLECARDVFARSGLSASLEEVARNAGVGIGTLYRNFPTREALIDELYRDQGDQLVCAANQFSREKPPIEALQAWLILFISFLESKQVMAGVIASISGDDEGFCSAAGNELVDALSGLLERAVSGGAARDDSQALDILCAIAGIATYGPQPGWEIGARRLVDVLIRGLVV